MKPNIVFFLIDGLRADKCFNKNKSIKTPNIDRLIENGIYFSQTISSSDATPISIGSIFTGLYPYKHGVGLHGHKFSKLHPNATSFIKILKNFGYHAYAIVPDLLEMDSLYCDFENNDKDYSLKPTFTRLYDGLDDRILNKLEPKSMKEPWFFFIHLEDLHTPIQVPEEFLNEKFGDSKYEMMVSVIDDWLGSILKKIETNVEQGKYYEAQQMYKTLYFR